MFSNFKAVFFLFNTYIFIIKIVCNINNICNAFKKKIKTLFIYIRII